MAKYVALFVALFVLTLSFNAFCDEGKKHDVEKQKLISAYSSEFQEMRRLYPDALSYSIALYDHRNGRFVIVVVKKEDFNFVTNGGNKNVVRNFNPQDVKYLRNGYSIVKKSYIDEFGDLNCIYVTTQRFNNSVKKGDYPNPTGLNASTPSRNSKGYQKARGHRIYVEPTIRTEGYENFSDEEFKNRLEFGKLKSEKETGPMYRPVVPLN